jgi:putative transposase
VAPRRGSSPKINGNFHYLWRAVDQHATVLDVVVQSRRNATAAKRVFRKLLKGLQYVSRVLVTDKLASYGVARRELMGSVTHRQSKYVNNRAENSHQPSRQRERAMKRFHRCATPNGSCPHSVASPRIFGPDGIGSAQPDGETEIAERFAVWVELTAFDAAA